MGYESDLEKVKELTLETLTSTFEQQSKEEIEFYYEGFGDSSINFVARFWAPVSKRRDMLIAQDKAIIAIKKAFDANDINIPFPIRTLDFGKNKFRSETITIANSSNGQSSEA